MYLTVSAIRRIHIPRVIIPLRYLFTRRREGNGFLEIRKQVFEAPPFVPEGFPCIIVGCAATVEEHAVYGTAAADDSGCERARSVIIEARIGDGCEVEVAFGSWGEA